ncbi:MAG TPA: hypothetical protein VF791_15455 [Pyrinomonadaceae bacterium]
MNYRKGWLSLLFTAIFLILAGFVVVNAFKPVLQNTQKANQQSNSSNKNDFESQFPVVDCNAPESTDPGKKARRRAVGAKYDKASLPIDPSSEQITHINEGEPLTALPVKTSSVVLIGKVTDAEAVLSNDHTGVYSEFTVRVEEVLKSDGQPPFIGGETVTLERLGGRVRFPSGHITLSMVTGTGMPRVGKRYAFFLVRNPQDFSLYIHTGYELTGGRAFPLDTSSQHPTKAYKGLEEAKLLKDLRAEV